MKVMDGIRESVDCHEQARQMDLPIVDISYLSRFYPHGDKERKRSTVRSISFYQHYY